MIFGREHELAALNTAYAQMLAGHGSVLFLTGEAGLGKTTLVHAWAAERDTQNTSEQQPTAHESQPATLFLESACSIPIGNVDVGRLEALQPWADVVAQLHEKLAVESNTSSSASAPDGTNGIANSQHKVDIRKLMRDAAPAWLSALPFVGEVAHAAFVTALLVKDQRTGTASHIHSPTAPDPSGSPVNNNTSTPVINERQFAAASQEQVFQQYVNLLTKIAEATPLVIFLDDLHWADTSSCNLLFYLARQIAGKKILVIATYRHDDAVRAEDGKGHAILTVKNEILRYSTGKELVLSYLSRDAIRAFLANTFVDYVDDDAFEGWLHKISDGNSLFMTQFVKTLREDGHLNDSGKFVGDYATVVIPTSALAVVEERTRRLDTDTRELLMYATAEGEEFTTYVLEHLSEMKPMALLKKLHGATTMGLITQRGTGRLYANTTTGIFGFSHALFHKALYDGLLDMQKQHLHQQCFHLLKAEWDRLLETRQRTTTLATKLLAHAGKCEEWTTVAEVALAVAQEFWGAFNEGEALAMITKVLEASEMADGLVADRLVAEPAEALFLRGGIGSLRGRHSEAAADYRAAEALFRIADFPDRAVDSVNGLAWTLFSTACYDAALAEAARALSEAHAVGYRPGEAIALNNIGNVHRHRGDNDEALAYFERSLAICTDIGDRRGEANALNNIGNVHRLRGDNDDARAYFERSLAIYTDIGDRRGEASTINNIGTVHNDLGAHVEALAYFERSLAIHTTIGDRRGEANALNNIGNVHGHQGDYDEALAYFERSLAIRTIIGDRRGEALALSNIGTVHSDLQDYDEALAYFERSLAICTDIGDRQGEAIALLSIGRALRQSGKIPDAREHLERSLTNALAISSPDTIANSTAELGLLAETELQTLTGSQRETKRADAQQLVEEAIVLFRDLKDDRDIDKWEKELARLKASA